MLNRRHIRVKVMQSLFSYKGGEGDDLNPSIKFLNYSISSMYDLYLLMIAILPEIHVKAESYLDKSKQKHLATKADKDPNKKFIQNQILVSLRENIAFKEELKKRKLTNWTVDDEYIDILFKDTLKSQNYLDYMNSRSSSFQEDLDFIVSLFKEVIAPNEKLYEYIEDKNLTWLDDLPLVNTTILKLLRKTKPNSASAHFLPPLYKDEEDMTFAVELFTNTVLNSTLFSEEIAAKTKNWDSERIAALDSVLLKMAICEFQKFPSIPVKVTINEYLEIAKEYSTPKSSIFINGILDKIVGEYKTDGKLNKTGRGLK